MKVSHHAPKVTRVERTAPTAAPNEAKPETDLESDSLPADEVQLSAMPAPAATMMMTEPISGTIIAGTLWIGAMLFDEVIKEVVKETAKKIGRAIVNFFTGGKAKKEKSQQTQAESKPKPAAVEATKDSAVIARGSQHAPQTLAVLT